MTRIGAAIAVLLAIATPAFAPLSSRAAIRPEPHYCMSDVAGPTFGTGGPVRLFALCSLADRYRRATWRT